MRLKEKAAVAGVLALLVPAGCGPSASSEKRTSGAPAAVSPDNYLPRGGSGERGSAEAAGSGRSPDAADATAGADPPARPRLSLRSGSSRDITFDDLEFDIARDAGFDRSMLGPEIEGLAGQSIVIRGFILASSVFQQKGIEQFVLVRDNQQCCFGPGAYIYHNIQVQMEPGKTASFSIRPVTVEGTFAIKPWIGPDGKCYSVYYMTARSVR